MNFTNDDLKRLKEGLCVKELCDGCITCHTVKALLARLEAAEDLLESLLTIIPHDERSASMDDQEYAWRKAVGKP